MPATIIEHRSSGAAPRRLRSLNRPAVGPLVALVLGVAAACAMYLPWTDTPFDILDFSEFLPLLTGNDSFASRFMDFAQYYASQGRANLLSYAFIIWKWSIFSWSEAGWQLARFAQMTCIVIGVYLLLRRLGAGRWGSVSAAALFMVAQSAAPAWMRLTMGEPLGLMAILGAALIATQYQETTKWKIAGAAIALLLTFALLAKEMLVALIPFVLLIAWTRHESADLAPPRLTRRNMWVALLTLLGVIAVGALVTIVAIRAKAGSYASDYSRGPLSLNHFVYNLKLVLLPTARASERHGFPLDHAGNIIFFAIVSAGALLAPRGSVAFRRWRILALAALALATTGAALYLPWPYFQPFYGLPFLLAPALVLALAVTAIEEARPSWRVPVYIGCALAMLQSALYAAHESRASIASRKLDAALVHNFAANRAVDSIVVAMGSLPSQAWQGKGPTLARYAIALLPGKELPPISDALCYATVPMIQSGTGNALLVSYSNQCGQFPVPAHSLRYYYDYLEWPTMSLRRDSLVISILGPEERK